MALQYRLDNNNSKRPQAMKEGFALRQQDRRLKVRHKAPTLLVSVSQKGLFRRLRTPFHVRCLDINRYGMAIETPQRLRLKERVLLDFKGRYISESDIEGIVTSAREVEGKFRYGISFAYCTCTKLYSREVDNALSRIETLCSQSRAMS